MKLKVIKDVNLWHNGTPYKIGDEFEAIGTRVKNYISSGVAVEVKELEVDFVEAEEAPKELEEVKVEVVEVKEPAKDVPLKRGKAKRAYSKK